MALGVEPLVVNQPQVVTLSEVVADPGVDAEYVGNAVVLQKRRGREVGIERRLDANLAQVCVEPLVSV